MRLSRQFRTFFLFFKKILSVKKVPKPKTNDFHPLRSSCTCKKTVAMVVFCSVIFVFVGWFWFICVFVRSKSFCKKNINWLGIVLIASFTILLKSTPIKPLMENLLVRTYFDLRSSVRISSLYDNLSYL